MPRGEKLEADALANQWRSKPAGRRRARRRRREMIMRG